MSMVARSAAAASWFDVLDVLSRLRYVLPLPELPFALFAATCTRADQSRKTLK